MGVRVTTNNETLDHFDHDAASGWHVDDDGRLHLRSAADKHGGRGNIAAYNTGVWFSVEEYETKHPAGYSVTWEKPVFVTANADPEAVAREMKRSARLNKHSGR